MVSQPSVQRSDRLPRGTLDPATVVAAALELADRDGLNAVTMARVAAELGSSAMLLYRNLRDEQELLEAIADRALAEIPAVAQDRRPRRVRLVEYANAKLISDAPGASDPDHYTYDPDDPTSTVGGNIVSYVYPPGSVDVSAVQQRPDVLTYTTAPLDNDLDVVGPLRLTLYASSSAVDTDFSARLSDVFPDGRAIQLQSGMLRARYRNIDGQPELLEPGRAYPFDIDMWATANRVKAGHQLRLDISSVGFPRLRPQHQSWLRGRRAGPCPSRPYSTTRNTHHDFVSAFLTASTRCVLLFARRSRHDRRTPGQEDPCCACDDEQRPLPPCSRCAWRSPAASPRACLSASTSG